MPDGGYVDRSSASCVVREGRGGSASVRRGLLLVFVAVAAVVGVLLTSSDAESQAVAQSGADLTRLLRAMAGIKAMAAIGLIGITYWRLSNRIGSGRFAVYALGCGAMAAGPCLIWDMAYLKTGALLLHLGLLTVGVALCLDPGMAKCIAAEIARRRARLRATSLN